MSNCFSLSCLNWKDPNLTYVVRIFSALQALYIEFFSSTLSGHGYVCILSRCMSYVCLHGLHIQHCIYCILMTCNFFQVTSFNGSFVRTLALECEEFIACTDSLRKVSLELHLLFKAHRSYFWIVEGRHLLSGAVYSWFWSLHKHFYHCWSMI